MEKIILLWESEQAMDWAGANVTERQFAPPSVAVSTVILSLKSRPPHLAGSVSDRSLWLPLVRRTRPPYLNQWALPGGPLQWNESLVDVAGRTLHAVTGLRPNYLEQLYAFGAVDRSPSHRVVSIVYWAFVNQAEAERAIESENVAWFSVDDLPELAFDHNQIVEYALCRVRNKVEYNQIAHSFLGETFTIAELREVYEAILGRQIDAANFRRQLLAAHTVVPTDVTVSGNSHRPARLYRMNPETVLAQDLPHPEPRVFIDPSRHLGAS